MRVIELIAKLREFPPLAEVAIHYVDGEYGYEFDNDVKSVWLKTTDGSAPDLVIISEDTEP